MKPRISTVLRLSLAAIIAAGVLSTAGAQETRLRMTVLGGVGGQSGSGHGRSGLEG